MSNSLEDKYAIRSKYHDSPFSPKARDSIMFLSILKILCGNTSN